MKSEPRTTFVFSVIRLVPDPIRDEAINVGVVVAAPDGRGEMKVTTRIRSRVRAMRGSLATADVLPALKGLETALGLTRQPSLGDHRYELAGLDRERMDEVAGRLNNQLQMTKTLTYVAASLEEAAEGLFRRYVGSKSRAVATEATRAPSVTRAELRKQIWGAVKDWPTANIRIRQGGLIDGKQAEHPADVIFQNGHVQAAMIALAAHPDDQHLSYVYRDSLPTIAADMGQSFRLYAVLPDSREAYDPAEQKFIYETKRFLRSRDVRAVDFDRLEDVKQEVIQPLL